MQITFPLPLNVSVQKTDTLYVSLISQDQSGVNNPFPSPSNTAPIAIGIVVSVNHAGKKVTIDPIPPYDDLNNPFILTTAHYVFFSKNRVANISGIVGYFAETEYRNYSKLQTEIFATAVDYVESSK
jgi:hypothetical protein